MQDAEQYDYQSLKDFLRFFSEKLMNLSMVSPDQRPIAALEEMERTSMAAARRGLRMAINDCVAMSENLGSREVFSLDEELKSHGIVTLSELRFAYSAKLRKVINRGFINNRIEYYFVKEVVEGNRGQSDASDLSVLASMLECYEARELSKKSK